MLKSVVAAVAATGIAGAAARGATIASWGFESVTPADATNAAANGPHAPDTGVGSASGLHASAGTDWTTPSGNGSTNAYSSNEWAVGDYYQFQVSTVGLDDISIAWNQTRSSTGPATFDLRYSTDGTNFTTFLNDYTVALGSWNTTTPDATTASTFFADLSAVTAIDNQATVTFRLVADAAPGASGGTNRIDNITISSGPVPEPSAVALLGIASLAVLRRRRAR